MKYHISPSTGNPNKCTAKPGACPFGSDEAHYSTPDEARAAYEAQQGSNLPTSPQDKLKAQAEAYVDRKVWGEFPAEASRAELMAASAKAKLENKFVPFAYRSVKPMKSLNLSLDYDNTGSDRIVLEHRTYGIALPSGEFVEVMYETELGAEYDDYWEFHPYFNSSYRFYENATAYRKREASAQNAFDQWEEAEAALRYEDRGVSRYDFNDADQRSTMNAGVALMDKMANPYGAARAVRLAHSKKRMGAEVLESEKYLHSPNGVVREALASRKELPKKAQAVLAADKLSRVRAALAYRDDLSSATLKTLLQQNEWQDRSGEATVRRHTLASPSLTPALMKREATNGDLEDLQALARNTNLTDEARKIIEQRTDKLGVRLPWRLPFYRQ